MEEQLNEEHAASAEAATGTDSSIQESGKKQPRKSKVMKLIRDMWPAYLIEIIVIILGISITLGLEEWRDRGKEKELEQVYLRNLQIDVEVDIKHLKAISGFTEKLLERGNALLTLIRNKDGKPLNEKDVNEDVRAILGRPKFLSQDATFSDLKSSGNLHLLKNIGLRNLLFDYYNRTASIKELQDAEQLATINLSGPFFLKNFQMGSFYDQNSSGGNNEKLTISSVEFDNQVLLRVLNRQELLEFYQKTDSVAESLKTALAEEISH